MKLKSILGAVICLHLALHSAVAADSIKRIPEGHSYVAAMKKVAARFRGREGVVLHVGDSITYANPYGQWAFKGEGKTESDQETLYWMHAYSEDDTDGWHLARVDRPGSRSDTAASGIRSDEALKGGKNGLVSLRAMLKKYQPRMVVLMLGTNDASANRSVRAYLADMDKAVGQVLEANTICILSTIPPHPHRSRLASRYNGGLRELAKRRAIPLIDFEREILMRRPKDWNGTLLGKDDVHPTATRNGVKPTSAPTEKNLQNSGYLLRGWLTVQKVAEVKRRVIDPLAKSK